MNERFDLVTRLATGSNEEWYKFSGTALRQIAGRSMHHATLLVDADLQALKMLICPPERDIRTSAIASVRSPIMNLSQVSAGLSVPRVVQALCVEWGVEMPVLLDDLSMLPSSGQVDSARGKVEEFVHRMESFEWIWGRTPPFSEFFPGWPRASAEGSSFRVRKGRVEAMAMPGANERQLEQMRKLAGRPYRGREVQRGLEGLVSLEELELLSSLIEGESSGIPAGKRSFPESRL